MKCGFFEEAPGKFSANRLIFVLGMFWAMAMTTYTIIVKHGLTMEIAASFGSVALVFAGLKVSQKFSEVKKEVAGGTAPQAPAAE